MKKQKLEAEIDYDFSLLAIISANRDYKFAWLINRLIDIQLNKSSDIEFDFLKSQNLIISNYTYETENSSIQLLKNKSVDSVGGNAAYLMPELNRFDYLMLVRGFEDTFSIEELKAKLSGISNVQFVQIFPVENLKSRENLIF